MSDPDRCPKCPHPWHGLPCNLRAMHGGDPTCFCPGAYVPPRAED